MDRQKMEKRVVRCKHGQGEVVVFIRYNMHSGP